MKKVTFGLPLLCLLLSCSKESEFVYVIEAPVLTQTLVSSPLSNAATEIEVGGKCTNGLPIKVTSLPSKALTPTELADINCQDGTWSQKYSDTEGQRVYAFVQVASNGLSSTQSVDWTSFFPAPVFDQTLALSPAYTNSNLLNMGGHCEVGLSISASLIAGSGAAQKLSDLKCLENGSWSYSASASVDGTYVYIFSQTNPIGKTTVAEVSWTLDRVLPAAPAVSVATPTKNPRPTWSWVSGGGGIGKYRVCLDSACSGGTASMTEVGNVTSYTPSVDLSDGSHYLTVQERDLAGNWSASASATVVVDKTPPNLTQTISPSTVTSNSTSLVMGGDCENGLPIVTTLKFNGATTSLPNNTCLSAKWSYSATASSQGQRVFSYKQTDAAGNSKSVAVTWTYGSSNVYTAKFDAGYLGDEVENKPFPTDIVFAIDVSGSMGGNIDAIKHDIASFDAALRAKTTEIRYGAVAFRDSIVAEYKLAPDSTKFLVFLNALEASGGGDAQEASLLAIQKAIANVDADKSPSSIKAIFMFTDNPGHNGWPATGNCNIDGTVDQFNARDVAALSPLNFFYSVDPVSDTTCAGYNAVTQMKAFVAKAGVPNVDNSLPYPVAGLSNLADEMVKLPPPTPVVCLARTAKMIVGGTLQATWNPSSLSSVYQSYLSGTKISYSFSSSATGSPHADVIYCCLPKPSADTGDFSVCVDQSPPVTVPIP